MGDKFRQRFIEGPVGSDDGLLERNAGSDSGFPGTVARSGNGFCEIARAPTTVSSSGFFLEQQHRARSIPRRLRGLTHAAHGGSERAARLRS